MLFKFFKNTGVIQHKIGTYSTFFKRSIATTIDNFSLGDGISQVGKLIKVELKNPTNNTILHELHDTIFRKNPDSLVIGMTPTVRMNSSSLINFCTGHLTGGVTDGEGNLLCEVSKHPDTKQKLAARLCVSDRRFKQRKPTVDVYKPLFLTMNKAIQKWVERAELVPDYPMYFHIIPMVPPLDISAKKFKDNVELIIEYDQFYALYSSIHPNGNVIPADNCISAVERSIFGLDSRTAHDMFCQEATINMVQRIIKPSKKALHSYLALAEKFGVKDGIECAEIEDCRAAFTC